MNTLDRVIADVFDRGAERRLSVEDEREAIRAAKNGDEAATVALIYAYAATLRGTAARHTETLGREEARQTAIVGLIEAVFAFDLDGEHTRLAAVVFEHVVDALMTAAGTTVAITVPPRTLKRFFGVLRRADGDVDRAADLAPSFDLSREAFLAVLSALRSDRLGSGVDDEGRSTNDDARPLWGEGSGVADAEDRILVETAFRAVDGFERDVCRLAYGFSDYEPVPDAEIAHRLGYSRPKVQRTRTGALVKMRDAIGL